MVGLLAIDLVHFWDQKIEQKFLENSPKFRNDFLDFFLDISMKFGKNFQKILKRLRRKFDQSNFGKILKLSKMKKI